MSERAIDVKGSSLCGPEPGGSTMGLGSADSTACAMSPQPRRARSYRRSCFFAGLQMSRLDISDSSPKGVALLMCERCETTPDGRRHVHGIFEHIITPVFPLKVTRFFVYIGVSGSGTEDFTLRLTGQDGSVITDGAFRVSDWGLAGVCEFSLAFLDVVFAKPGRYSLRLSGRGWVVDRTRPSARRKALNQRTRSE